MSSEILKREIVSEEKFLQLENITFKNDDGKILKWEACQRKNNANAVSIFTVLKQSKQFLFVKEYRAPIGTYCIGNPAGLIEQNEDIKSAAIRELKEETGYVGNIVYIGYPSESSAGLTGELTTNVLAIVDESLSENQNPKQSLEDTEHIEIIKVPFASLTSFIREQHEKGCIFSAKIDGMIIGMNLQILFQ